MGHPNDLEPNDAQLDPAEEEFECTEEEWYDLTSEVRRLRRENAELREQSVIIKAVQSVFDDHRRSIGNPSAFNYLVRELGEALNGDLVAGPDGPCPPTPSATIDAESTE